MCLIRGSQSRSPWRYVTHSARRLFGEVKFETSVSTFNRPSGTFQFSFRGPALCFAACRAVYNRASGADGKKALSRPLS